MLCALVAELPNTKCISRRTRTLTYSRACSTKGVDAGFAAIHLLLLGGFGGIFGTTANEHKRPPCDTSQMHRGKTKRQNKQINHGLHHQDEADREHYDKQPDTGQVRESHRPKAAERWHEQTNEAGANSSGVHSDWCVLCFHNLNESGSVSFGLMRRSGAGWLSTVHEIEANRNCGKSRSPTGVFTSTQSEK